MAEITEYENLKKKILDKNKISAEHLIAIGSRLSSNCAVKDLPSLLPVVFDYAFSEDKPIQKAAIPVLQRLANLLDANNEVKNNEWWPDFKANIANSVSKIAAMLSEGREEWCELWCSAITMMGKELRLDVKTVNTLLKVAEKAFKISTERCRGFECWRKLIDNFALSPTDMNSKRRLNLLLIPLQAQNHGSRNSCLAKLNTWKHLLSNLNAHNELALSTVVPPFLQFMYEGIGVLAPACDYWPVECAQIFKLLLTTEVVFQALSQQFIKDCGTCVISLRNVDTNQCIDIWSSMIAGVRQMGWPDNKVAEIMQQLKRLHEDIGTSVLFTDILTATYNTGMSTSLVCKHYNTFISMIISPYVICNINENIFKTFMDIMDSMNSFLLSEGTFQLIMDRLLSLFESDIQEEMMNDLDNNLRIIWSSLCDAMCKWIANGGHSSEDRTKEDMRLIHNVLIFGITRLQSQWNKSLLRSWKLLFSESLKYFLLLMSVNSEQFVVDLIERMVKAIKKQQISLLIAVEISSILLEFCQSKESNSISSLLMEIGEKVLNLISSDMPKGLPLLNQYLKVLLVAVRSRPMLATVCISVTENLSQIKVDLPVADNQKISARVMKTHMQLMSLKTVKTTESPVPSPTPSPTMTSFLHRLAKAEGNKTKSRVCSQQISQETKQVSQSSPRSVKPMFMDSSSQDDYVFVPPKKTVIPLTEHQKERMARRSDIPALYQDLSQDSQSVNLESISFSHTEPKADSKSPKKNNSPTKSPVKHFSAIESGRTSPRKNNSLSNSLLKSPDKRCSSVRNITSPLKCRDNSGFKLLNQVEEATTPTKVITSDSSPSKIRSSPRLTNEKLSTVNKEIDFESIGQLSNKNKITTPIKANTYLNVSAVLSESTSKLNKTLHFEDDNKSVVNKRVQSPRKKSISVNEPSENVNIDENNQKINLQGPLFGAEEDVINLEESSDKVERLNDGVERAKKKLSSSDNTLKIDCVKVENCLDTAVDLKSFTRSTEKKTVVEETPKSITDISVDKTVDVDGEVQIIKEIKNELFQVENCNDNDAISTVKEELVKVKNEIKKSGRKSMPAKFSPIKTRRSSRQSQFTDITGPRHRRSLSNTKKSVVNLSPTKQSNLHSRRVVKKTPEVDKKESKIVKCDRNQDEEGKKKRKLNGSTVKVSGKRAKLNINEESKELDKEKSVSITNGKDCNSNTDVPVEVESESKEISNKKKINEDIALLETSDKSEEKILEDECKDDIKVKTENIVLVPNESPKISDGKSVRSPATISRNLFSNKIETDVQGNKEQPSSLAKRSETTKKSQKTNEGVPLVEDDKMTNKELVLDQETTGTSLTEQTSLLSHIVELNGIIKSPRKLKTDSPSKSNKHVTKENLKGNCVMEPVLYVTDICRTPVKQHKEIEITARTHVTLTLDNKVTSNSTDEEIMNISMTPEDIAMLEENKIIKQKAGKSEEEIFDPIDEVVLSDSNSSDEIKLGTPFVVHSPKKKIETTPQKVSKKQIELLKHSPILDKLLGKADCTPPKDITTDQSVSTVPISSDIDVVSKNSSESSKIVNKKLTSPNLTGWVLRTPIKKSPEIINCDQSVPETTSEEIQPESVDLIPCSQEVTDKSLKFLKVVVEKLSDLKSSPSKLHSSPSKLHSSPKVTRSLVCSQNELVEESETDKTSHSPKKNTTPVKKSVCRRLVIDNDKAMIDTEDGLGEENSFPSPSKTEKLNIPVLTSDRDDDMCKDLIVQHTTQNSNEKLLSQSIVEKDEEKTKSGDLAQNEIYGEMNQLAILRKSNRIMPQSPKKSSESEVVVLSSPKSPKRRTSQLMALAFKKDDSGDGQYTPINRKLKKNQLFRPIDSSTVECQQTELTPLTEAWVCRIYSPSASPNTSILKRKVNVDISPEPSSPVHRDKRKRVSFLDPVVSESLVFSKSEFGKGQIMRTETKQVEPRFEVPDIPSPDSVTEDEVEPGDSQEILFPALESCDHPIAHILERDVTKHWLKEMVAKLERFDITTIGDLCKLSEATIKRLPFPPPKVTRLRALLQEYFDELSQSPPKKSKVSPTKHQTEAEQDKPNIASGAESLNDITGKVSSYFQTHPGLVESLGKTLDVDTIMSMLNVAVTCLKSKQNS